MRRAVLLTTMVSLLAPDAQAADAVLYRRPAGGTLVDSKYGAIADLQNGLLTAASSCGINKSAIVLGQFRNSTSKLVRDVARCRKVPLGDTSGNTITEDFWRVVVGDVAPPDAAKRAWAMSFKFEGTDYDVIEFNVGTSDPGILTWGPLGATAGQAFQVQRIIAQIDAVKPGLIGEAFGEEADQVRMFAAKRTTKSATDVISAVKAKPGRAAAWRKGFALLGSDRDARRIYDDLMSASATAGVPEAIADFTRAYWSHCMAPTEVDYGFFFDRAVQIDVKWEIVEAADAMVQQAEQRAGHKLSAPERRRAFAANWAAGNRTYVGDRLARDVGYYVDAVGKDGLTDASLLALRTNSTPASPQLNDEYGKWIKRSGFKASYYGLSDDRVMPVPPSLAPSIPMCLKPVYASGAAG